MGKHMRRGLLCIYRTAVTGPRRRWMSSISNHEPRSSRATGLQQPQIKERTASYGPNFRPLSAAKPKDKQILLPGSAGFKDFSIRRAVLDSMKLQYASVRTPTLVQLALLSALQGQHSFVGVSPSGTGKSFALTAHIISNSRFRAPLPSVTTLLLVPSIELGFQYIELIASLLRTGNAPVRTQEVAQFLYRPRSGTEDLNIQLELLRQYPAPNILVSTPNRLLDMFSNEEERKLLNLGFLRTVVIDEADQLIRPERNHKQNQQKLKSRKKRHERPVVLAMDYIAKTRNTALKTYSLKVPLQVVMLSSSMTVADDLYQYAISTKWMKDSTIKTYGTSGYSDIILNTPFVESYTVTYNAKRRTLYDTTEKDEAQEKVLYEPITPGITQNDLNALKILLKRDSMKKAIVVLPSDASRLVVRNHLQDLGISAVSLDYFGGSKIADYQEAAGYGLIDTQTMFLTHPDVNDVTPDVILATAAQLYGLNFPGLSRIYVLGPDSVSSVTDYSALLLRTRVSGSHDVEKEAFSPETIRAQPPSEKARVVFVTVNDEYFEEKLDGLNKYLSKKVHNRKQMFPDGPVEAI